MNKNVYQLKFSLIILFLCILVSDAYSQGGANPTTDQSDKKQEAVMTDLQLRPIRLPALQEVGGSPFLSNDYKSGTIQINNDKTITNVPVKFNIFSNAVMVQKDGKEMKLESFELVTYDETVNDGAIKHINFRQGYPEIDNHTGTTVYQALSFGPKIHLLKFLSQKVEDAPTLGDYSRREIITSQQLYIFIPGGEIKKIKAGKQSVVDALPGMTSEIEEIIKAKNLNLKSERDIATLADLLNR